MCIPNDKHKSVKSGHVIKKNHKVETPSKKFKNSTLKGNHFKNSNVNLSSLYFKNGKAKKTSVKKD